ncbi:MAG: FHA domain-containing protein, partial [Anaerolineae bacterium]
MAQEIIHQLKISGPGIDQTFVIPPGITTIGRQDTNQLVLIHPLVSRRHAEIVCADDACTIADLGSMHGTMVNRERLESNT